MIKDHIKVEKKPYKFDVMLMGTSHGKLMKSQGKVMEFNIVE